MYDFVFSQGTYLKDNCVIHNFNIFDLMTNLLFGKKYRKALNLFLTDLGLILMGTFHVLFSIVRYNNIYLIFYSIKAIGTAI